MSNMGPYGNAKATPWGRGASVNLVNQAAAAAAAAAAANPLQQQLINQGALGNLNASGMVQFQQQQQQQQQQHQQQVFQNAISMQQQNMGIGMQPIGNTAVAMGGPGLGGQIFQQVAYPNPRAALNPTAFQTPQQQQQQQTVPVVAQNSQNSSGAAKQRVFTGTVTKVHDNFGFVDEDVFFQTTACAKGSNPMVGDRVLVEASYNPSMPFKWNATRIQVLPATGQAAARGAGQKGFGAGLGGYNAVPPPSDGSNGAYGRNNHRNKGAMGGRGRERSRDRDREEEENERKKRREERAREREKEEKKSPLRRRSRSPKSRRRSRIVPRYMVQIPKIALDLPQADLLEVRRRYSNLYIPSDFFYTRFRWIDAFPPDKPFSLNKPCQFHIMSKEVDPVIENDTVLEPPDSDYVFCAKVMLMSVPGMEEIYQKCCAMAEDKDKRDRDSEDKDYIHPTRLINFLVGLRGKNETMAIGGPWSPVDGENPGKDPLVLIRTAIRTCKALTGIDLSNCTQWYRFLELYYRRGETVHKGRTVPARVETVVLFLPDVWSCVPTRLEWDGLQLNYSRQLDARLKQAAAAVQETEEQQTGADEKEEEPPNDKPEPTHYSQLDPKAMAVSALRTELKARGVSYKGLKSQLAARLAKLLKAEAEKNEDAFKDSQSEPEADVQEDKKSESEERKIDEKEKAQLQKLYTLPEQQHIIVHPSRTAKQGKFDCTTMSLSLLLDYRPEDTKEHSFEVSLFAELFNEMLMRDFGFNIYKALFDLPEKPKEKDKDEKKKKEEDDEKKKGDDKSKEEKKKEEKKEEREKKSEDEKRSEKKEEDSSKKKDAKKEDKRSENNDETEDEDEFEEDEHKEKKKEKKKKQKVKMYTKDRHLLLSFVYFDQTHCGYIFEKDIEDLLHTLGLRLSRAQVRKLVNKVITRDSLHYRKLTDHPKDEEFIVIDDSEKDINLHELAVGNKRLLPVFKEEELEDEVKTKADGETANCEDGMIMFRGALVDVGKLMSQLERSDKARIDTEACMIDLKNENNKLLDKVNKSNASIKHLNTELKEYKDKLKLNEESLMRVTACSRLFQTTLVEIRDKIDPVLKSTYNKDDAVKREPQDKEHKHDETKTRWERDIKETVAKEEPMEDVK